MSMNLKDVFDAVAYKELRQVDLPERGSNQHELNGTIALCDFFAAPKGVLGSDFRVEGVLQWLYFADNQDTQQTQAPFTFYDARARTASTTGRSEWRLYYYGDFLSVAQPGDALILARTKEDTLLCLVFQENSGWLRAARALFGINPANTTLQAIPDATLDARTLDFAQIQILEELGIEITVPATPTDEEIILAKFGNNFPTTAAMSAFARTQIQLDTSDCDTALVGWLGREEALFRALEGVGVRQQLAQGFRDVEHFISYSLSVQNRRKSRMGNALQNHLAALFDIHGLRYQAQKTTEGRNKPDFLFPGQMAYRDPAFSDMRLAMLAAKSSCKERWTQILPEANRIPEKHLCTLEQGISSNETDKMQVHHVHLVIPALLHITYTPQQRPALMSLNEFVDFIRSMQSMP